MTQRARRGSLAALLLTGLLTVVLAGCAATTASGADSPPTTAPTVAAAAAEPVAPTPTAVKDPPKELKLFCYVETLTADRPSVYGYLAPRGCQPSGMFKRGERMVFRFEMVDRSTGEIITPAHASRVSVVVPYVGEQQADFKQRGEGKVPDAPWTWDFCWDVPLDYPLGTLDYSITVSLNDGRSATWKPPALVDPSRGIDSRPQIIE